ncbi:hypothetical protein [Kocuria palustris]|uniref:hypothetical protein n=1 Tax=Kocuria palustris TaxID=71999 RepID=UPI00119DE461|nr:hypothetical protein [Kocuria palustris]
MPSPHTGRAVSPDAPAAPGQIVAAMAAAGLSPGDVRRRLHMLYPDLPLSFWAPWLRRGLFAEHSEPPGGRRAPHDDRLLRLGVELVAAIALRLAPDAADALLLAQEDLDALEDLLGEYDPSGAILAECLKLIGAMRRRIDAGARPLLSESAYHELLVDIRLVGDAPEALRLAWPPAASVVSWKLGGGDWTRALASLGLDGGQPSASAAPPPRAAREVQELEDPGIALVAAPAGADAEPEHVWDELRDRLAEELAGVAWKDVLVLRYSALPGQDVPPSAWARTGPDGTHVHLSGVDGSSARWPREDSYFDDARWRRPSVEGVAWNAGPLPFVAAAELMVEGMRFGRLCSDPYRFCWGVGDAGAADARAGTDDDPAVEQEDEAVAAVLPFTSPE